MADVFSLAKDWEARGRFDLAIEEYDRLADSGATCPEALMRRAALFRERGDLTRAIADYERVEALKPDDPWPKLRLGQLAGSAGRDMVAASYMQAAFDAAPQNDEFRVNLANIYSAVGYLDLAFHAAHRLPEALSDWWARARKTALTTYREHRSETLARLRARTRSGGMDREERWRLSQDLFFLGRLKLARRLCEELVSEGPHSPPAFYFLARILARQEGLEKAIGFLQTSASIKDDLPDYPIRLGRLLHEAGRYEEALEQFAHPAVAGLDAEEVRWARFAALLLLGQQDRLIDYCREWLRIAPDSLAPAGYLAAMYSERSEPRTPRPRTVATLKPHIVQFWDSESIPSDVQDVMSSWRQAHPHVQHVVFDARSARDFIETHYGSEVVETFDLCHHPAMTADYFRIAFLYHSGGVYADADERCLQPIHDILEASNETEIIATLSGDVPGYLHNWFLGNRPRSRIMRAALEDATKSVRAEIQAGRRPDIWLATGPGLITRAVGRYLADRGRRDDEALLLLPLQQYRSLARTESSLMYKTNAAANWQLA